MSEEKRKTKYRVHIGRYEYTFGYCDVEAVSPEEAEKAALELADDIADGEWMGEGDYDYKPEGVAEIGDDEE